MLYLLDFSLSFTLMSSLGLGSSSSESLPTFWNLLLRTLLMELTLGTDDLSHIPSFNNRSLISQLNIPGFSRLYCSIFFSTSGVATRGLLPPMTPGRMLPVSWYLCRILLTQPCDTRNCLLMTQGRTPWAANSTIFRRMWFGRGLPLINTPPSWFTLPCP